MTIPWGLLGLLASAAGLVLVVVLLLLARRLRHPPRRTAGWALARDRPADPSDLGLAHREDDVGGMPLWIAARDEATLASGDAPTVVILHGWGRSRRDMLARLEPWRRLGFRMAIPDLRGHGDAEGPSTLGTAEVDDLLTLLESLSADTVRLCGHSMGGVIAIHAAARRRDAVGSSGRLPKIGGIVAIAPYERVRIPAVAQLEASGIGARWCTTPLLAILNLLGVREASTRDAAKRLNCPLLVLHGDEDRLCPHADAERIADAAGELGRFATIAGAGHDDLRSAATDAIESAIEEWLEVAKAGQTSPDLADRRR